MNEEAFLRAIRDDPSSAATTWLVLADWLEERNDPRAELVRLCHDRNFRSDLSPLERDERVRQLLASGLQPCVPTIANSLGMRLALIPPGTFLMGSPDDEEGRLDDESRHEVEITSPFFMGVGPVTQEEYQGVTGTNPSWFSPGGDGGVEIEGLNPGRLPVESISWQDAVEFCAKLSELPEEKKHGRLYRLPSEAEWEYACRGGAVASMPFHWGKSPSSTQANFNGNRPSGSVQGPDLQRTTAVGSYPSNAFGLYELHGNVWEWCADWYGEYPTGPAKDPAGPVTGTKRVLRGGAWSNSAEHCRAACRGSLHPGIFHSVFGFRAVCVLARTS